MRSKRSQWGLAWISWAALFAAIESRALRAQNRDEATLSSHVRWVFGYDRTPNCAHLRVRQTTGAAAWAWVFYHIMVKPRGWRER